MSWNYSTFIAASAWAHFGNVSSLAGSHSKMLHLVCLRLSTTSTRRKHRFFSWIKWKKGFLLSFVHMGHAAWTQALTACGGLQISSKQSWRVSAVSVGEDPHSSTGKLRSNCFIMFLLFAFSSWAVYTNMSFLVLQHVCFPHYFPLPPLWISNDLYKNESRNNSASTQRLLRFKKGWKQMLKCD